MAVNWGKKKVGLCWGTGCGIFFLINQVFLDSKLFNGRNPLWEDIALSAIAIVFPILLVFLFYWPREKTAEQTKEKEDV